AAVLNIDLSLRLDAPGRVDPVRRSQCVDDEISAAVLRDVGGIPRVVFQLPITPAILAVSNIEGPLRRIGQSGRGTVELVAPDELPVVGPRRNGGYGHERNTNQWLHVIHPILPTVFEL